MKDSVSVDSKNENLEYKDCLLSNMFNYIKFENISELTTNIDKSEYYEFLIKPDGAYLKEFSDGSVSGVWRDNKTGKIKNHSKLKKVASVRDNGLKLTNIFINKIMLGAILLRINHMDNKIDLILDGQSKDRLAEIKSAVEEYQRSDYKNYDSYNAINLGIINGIIKVKEEINTTILNLNKDISPMDIIKHVFNRKYKKNKDNDNIYSRIEIQIAWIFEGFKTLFEIDLKFKNFKSMKKDIDMFKEFLDETPWELLIRFSKAIKNEKDKFGFYPMDKWLTIKNNKNQIIDNLKKIVSSQSKECEYSIRTKGKLLKEILHEKM